MAYTIISQNNTTTTLADENGNVITVPARVTLATSTDYTITKVNNNSVDLVDGNGKVIRGVPACVVLAGGGGGGDQHNLGYYADLTALQTAHPTGSDGDFAILGSTDTIWVWDSGTSAWKDTDQKGQVESVNGQTGDVTLTIPDAVQYSTMPTAGADNLGKIVQFTGTTDANYTNGYFYKCESTTTPSSATVTQTAGSSLSDITVNVAALEQFFGWTTDNTFVDTYTENGWAVTPVDFGVTFTGTPVVGDEITVVYTAGTVAYAWTRVDVQPAPVIPDPLPSQTGNAGKFLSTDGTDASWSDKPLVNTATGNNALSILGSASTTYGAINIGAGSNSTNGTSGVAIGNSAVCSGSEAVAIGRSTNVSALGCVAVGHFAQATANQAIQLGATSSYNTNSDANTFKVANANGNFEIMSADGTVPTARLTKVNTTATLAVADWSSNTQTVTVSGVKADSVVFVSPAPASASDYASAGILCTAQAANSLTFSCTQTPTNAITVNIVCF